MHYYIIYIYETPSTFTIVIFLWHCRCEAWRAGAAAVRKKLEEALLRALRVLPFGAHVKEEAGSEREVKGNAKAMAKRFFP